MLTELRLKRDCFGNVPPGYFEARVTEDAYYDYDCGVIVRFRREIVEVFLVEDFESLFF